MPRETRESLLLLPGLLCDAEVWRHQAQALADVADCRSVEWNAEDSLPAMAGTVLRQAPSQFYLAGHSMGGRVVLEIYAQAPQRVKGIALLNTGYQAPAPETAEQEARSRYALLEVARTQGMPAMARQWLPPMIHPGRLNDAALVEAIVAMFARKTPDTFAAQIKALLGRPDRTALLSRIQCPALVLTGREDAWSPPARHAEIAARIPGSQLVVVPECGHMSPLERPLEVSQAFREWLPALS
jgi:pimeloyl-ACP methyl ester carboxylesterase